jgi:hypothetical protein
MTNIKDYMLWLQQQQTQKPEWQAAKRWQERNQTPLNTLKEIEKEKTEEMEETPDPSE